MFLKIHDLEEKIIFSINDAGATGHPHVKFKKKKNNLNANLALFTKINSKWIKT